MKSFKNNNLNRKGKGIERIGRKQKAKYKAPFLAGRFLPMDSIYPVFFVVRALFLESFPPWRSSIASGVKQRKFTDGEL